MQKLQQDIIKKIAAERKLPVKVVEGIILSSYSFVKDKIEELDFLDENKWVNVIIGDYFKFVVSKIRVRKKVKKLLEKKENKNEATGQKDR